MIDRALRTGVPDGGRVTAVAAAAALYLCVLSLSAMTMSVFARSFDAATVTLRRDVETLLVAASWLLDNSPNIDSEGAPNDDGDVDLLSVGARLELSWGGIDGVVGGRTVLASVFDYTDGRPIGVVRAALLDGHMHIVGVSCYGDTRQSTGRLTGG